MASRLRSSLLALSALSALAVAGCDWGTTDPVSLSINFRPAHTLNADGSCRVQFVAQASGFGTAQWERVVIRESGSVVEEFVGAGTAEFWGEDTISAGQQQESAPHVAPETAGTVEVDVWYRISGPERLAELPVHCGEA